MEAVLVSLMLGVTPSHETLLCVTDCNYACLRNLKGAALFAFD